MVPAAVGLVAAVLLWLIWTLDPEQLIQRFTHDDSFYYLETARRFTEGEGFTFDGRNVTNGFHPLWMILLLPIYAAVGSQELVGGLRVVLSVQTLLFFVPTALMAYAAARRLAGAAAGLAALAAALWLMPARQVNAMESGVLLFAFMLVTWWVARRAHRLEEPGTQLVAGLFLGLTFLGRTDSVFLMAGWGAAALVLVLSSGTERRLGRYLRVVVPSAVGVLIVAVPYLAYNLTTEGHLLPISGALKTSLPELTWSPRYLRGQLPFVLAGAASLVLGVLRGVRAAPDEAARRAGGLLMVAFGVYTLVHTAFTVFAMKWAVFSWHFVGYTLPVILLVALAAGALVGRRPPPAGVVAVALVGALALSTARALWSFRPRPALAFYVHSYRAAQWANANLPPGARIAMKDAGALGYFADASVTNLDGVINNYDYQDYLREQRLTDYLRDQGITHVAQHALWEFPEVQEGGYGSFTFPIESNLYDVPGGEMVLREEDELYRAPAMDAGRESSFVIWSWDAEAR